MSGDQIFWICISGIIGITIVAATPLIGFFWRVIIRDVKVLSLKSEMVQQGYPAEDIERVVQASPESEKSDFIEEESRR